MEAQIRRLSDSLQLSYDLGCQPSDSSVYPLPATDGATIVVLGHSKGLSILKVHGSSHSNAQDVQVEHNSDHTQHGTSVAKWLDIKLESPVQHLAFPPITLSALSALSNSIPEYLRTHVTLAAACADSSIWLVSFDRGSSPRRSEEGNESGITVTKISSAASHQDLVASLAVTWTASGKLDDQNKTQPRRRGRTDAVEETELHYFFLVAAASTTGSGLLVVNRVSMQKHISSKGSSAVVVARQFMRQPLLKSTIQFNPICFPSMKHSTLLLVSPATGTIKILDVLAPGLSVKKKTSNLQGGEEDTATVHGAAVHLTLHSGFCSSIACIRRKEIHDAKWVMQGSAIVALLEDGEWGIWNIDGGSSSKTDKTRNASIRPTAASPTNFVACGNVSTTLRKAKATKNQLTGGLAPTTPHTRGTKLADLLGDNKSTSQISPLRLSTSGRVQVFNSRSTSSGVDESLIISYDDNNNFIPSLSFWQPESGRGTATGKLSTGRILTLPSARLGGEKQQSINILPSPDMRGSGGLLAALNTAPDVLLVTHSRLVIHTKTEPKATSTTTNLNLPLRGISAGTSTLVTRSPSTQMLDIDVMDQMLDAMDDNRIPTTTMESSPMTEQPHQQYSTDPDTMSPTLPKSSKAKLTINKQGSDGRSNLFG